MLVAGEAGPTLIEEISAEEYNTASAPNLSNPADGCIQFPADQPGAVRVQ
jgi:hypothetical protein